MTIPSLDALGPFLPLILLFAVFYFLLIRPQQKQQKQRQEMLKNLKKGDRVLTIGGVYGLIKEIDDKTIMLRVAENVNLKVARAAVDRVVEAE
ncbi:MAG TPA: preprotein translocase subunit YajC [Candidatus Limnocylindrales bacterium]|nr:preprotein translocase subunit YajC [Candidatus Limnocylindrales bacterium]